MAVYCSECLYFRPGIKITHPLGPTPWLQERCVAPQNFKKTHRENTDWPKSQPRQINRFGNCSWYIPLEGSSSSSSSGAGPVPLSSSSSDIIVLSSSSSS